MATMTLGYTPGVLKAGKFKSLWMDEVAPPR
jgi:hypothetical protein